jgi:excisionase family DNA binding protein
MTLTPTDKLAYSVGAAAAAMSVSRGTIYNRIADGSLPAVQYGGRLLIRRADLEAALDAAPKGVHVVPKPLAGRRSHSTIPRPGTPPNR